MEDPGAEEAVVECRAGRRAHERLVPLELDPQDVDHIAPRQDGVELVSDLAAETLPGLRHQGRRAAEDDLGTQLGQAPDVGTCHP